MWNYFYTFSYIYSVRKTGMLKISFLYKNRLSYESLIMVSNTRSTMCVRGFWRQILVYTLLTIDTLMAEIQPTVFEKSEHEYQEKSSVYTLCGFFNLSNF